MINLEAIRTQEPLFFAYAENSKNAIFFFDNRIIYANSSMLDLTGLSDLELLQIKPIELLDPDFKKEWEAKKNLPLTHLRDLLDEESVAIKTKEATIRWVNLDILRYEKDGNSFFVGTFVDVSTLKETQAKLEMATTLDPLTDALNRKSFEKLFEEEIERSYRYNLPLSLIMFDIDMLHYINEEYGQEIGDKILKTVAEIALKTLRSTDSIVRWSGGKFAVLLTNISIEEAKIVAERIRNLIFMHEYPYPLRVTCSFGVVSYKKGLKLDAMVRMAEDALYLAKNSGRNKVVGF